jgi:hypothetical protein
VYGLERQLEAAAVAAAVSFSNPLNRFHCAWSSMPVILLIWRCFPSASQAVFWEAVLRSCHCIFNLRTPLYPQSGHGSVRS